MAVYQTFVNAMNEKIRRTISVNNPFVFKHISNLKGIDHFDDVGPCVILASPGNVISFFYRFWFVTLPAIWFTYGFLNNTSPCGWKT